jgi:hypothetical protein
MAMFIGSESERIKLASMAPFAFHNRNLAVLEDRLAIRDQATPSMMGWAGAHDGPDFLGYLRARRQEPMHQWGRHRTGS